jgi:hypothetical protein
MGCYDFFKGKCPHCDGQVDQRNGKPGGDIQTKAFSNCSFRTFYPGDTMPHLPGSSFMNIGRSLCCDKQIVAGFRGKVLLGYFTSEYQYGILIDLIVQKEEKQRQEEEEKVRSKALEAEARIREEVMKDAMIRDRMDRIRIQKTQGSGSGCGGSKNQKKHEKRAKKRSEKAQGIVKNCQ